MSVVVVVVVVVVPPANWRTGGLELQNFPLVKLPSTLTLLPGLCIFGAEGRQNSKNQHKYREEYAPLLNAFCFFEVRGCL